MKRILSHIDSANEWMGLFMRWVAIGIVVVVVAEVIMRFGFNRPTIQLPEIVIMMGAGFYALSWGYCLLHQGHVRVDIFYARLSPRGKALIDAACFIIFFLPLMGVILYAGWSWTWYAWVTTERSLQTHWYPIMGPIRTVVYIGLVLFTLQGIAQFIRDMYFLTRKRPL